MLFVTTSVLGPVVVVMSAMVEVAVTGISVVGVVMTVVVTVVVVTAVVIGLAADNRPSASPILSDSYPFSCSWCNLVVAIDSSQLCVQGP